MSRWLPILLTSLLVVPAAAGDDWRAQLEAGLANSWAGLAECDLEPLETFTLYLDGQGAMSEVEYQGFDAAERESCLVEGTQGLVLPAPPDGLRHALLIRVEDLDLDIPYAIEDLGVRCDEQVVDMGEQRAVFAAHEKELKRCQQRRLLVDRTLRGEVLLAYTLDPQGRVSQVVIKESGLEHRQAEACIVERVSTLAFPAPREGCSVTLEHRLDFGLPGLLEKGADVADRVGELKAPAIRACGAEPDEEGTPTAVVKLHIASGAVLSATLLERYVVSEEAAACLVDQARSWTFEGIVEARILVHFRLEDPDLFDALP